METNTWWRSRKFELALAASSVVFICIGAVVDQTFPEWVANSPVTANILASFLSLPLISLAAILVLNKGEQQASEAHARQVERRRLLTGLADSSHFLGQGFDNAVLLTDGVAPLLRTTGEHGGLPSLDWKLLCASADYATLVRLVQMEPRSTERLAEHLDAISRDLEVLATLTDAQDQSRLLSARTDMSRAMASIEDLLKPARTVCTGVRFIRDGRTWNGAAVVDGLGSSYTLKRSDFTDTADLVGPSRLAVEDAIRGLEFAIDRERRQLSLGLRLRRALFKRKVKR